MKELLVVVPSRDRPENMRRLIQSMNDTCQGDTTLLIGLDHDDPQLEEYRAVLREYSVLSAVKAGMHQVTAWINALAMPEVDNYRFIGTVGDDNTFDTSGWDLRVIESLKSNDFCFGDDLYPREKGSLCCHVFTRSKIIKALGYFAYPGVRHMYCDPIWYAWGKATSIEFLADMQIEHHHYSNGKAPMDLSYLDSTACIPGDCLAYNEYMETKFAADVEKIKGAMIDVPRFNYDLNIPKVFGTPLTKPD